MMTKSFGNGLHFIQKNISKSWTNGKVKDSRAGAVKIHKTCVEIRENDFYRSRVRLLREI